MAGEAETKLYVAATQGDVTTFQDVLQQSPHLLDGAPFSYSRNLLHIATMWEQVGIVDEILRRNPKLAADPDSQNSSPLHIAAANGNLQISSKLLAVAPKMCWSLDCQGMNPIHIAAMYGNVEVLEHLLQFNSSPAMERLNCRQTILHLCVKHGQLRTLQVLFEKFGNLAHAKDDDGETLLHLAVRCNELEIVRYLVERKYVIVITRNPMEYSPMKILEDMPRNDTTLEIKKLLEAPGILKLTLDSNLLNAVMVVLILIATLAFQSTVSPPGGVWQDDSSTHKAGEAVMASSRPKVYQSYILFNSIAFSMSVSAMLAIIPAYFALWLEILPWIALIASCFALYAVIMSYVVSLLVILPNSLTHTQAQEQAIALHFLTYVCEGFAYFLALFAMLVLFQKTRIGRRWILYLNNIFRTFSRNHTTCGQRQSCLRAVGCCSTPQI